MFLSVEWVPISRNVPTDITLSRKCKKVNFLTKEVQLLDCVMFFKNVLGFFPLSY